MPKKLDLHLPELSAFVLVLGILKTFYYYTNFGVSIKSFIGLSEIGLFVSGDLIVLSILLILVLLFFKIVFKKPSFHRNNSEALVMSPIAAKRKNSAANIFYWLVVIIITGFMLFVCAKSSLFTNRITYLLFTIAIVYFSALLFNPKKSIVLLGKSVFKYSIGFFYFMFAFLLFTSNEIRSVENGKYKGTKIITSDSIYVSTDSSFYIGQTEKYVFFYNKMDNHTTAIPTSEVKKLELFKNKTTN